MKENFTIFYDLETSSLEFCGQIINFAFVVVDENWNITDKYTNKIHISNTQLPDPEAIEINKIDVIEHQNETKDFSYSESISLQSIYNFIESWTLKSESPVPLIGYNSTNFDLPYLRTSMIRNGINPYFKNVVYGDLLYVSQYLSLTQKSFYKTVLKNNQTEHFSLSLSSLIKTLLEEKQNHESLDDVYLLISLAKYYDEKYNVDVRTFNSYQPKNNQKLVKRILVDKQNFNDKSCKLYSTCILLDESKNNSLWIDLNKFEEETKNINETKKFKEWLNSEEAKKVIYWFNKSTSSFFIENFKFNDLEKSNAEEIKSIFNHINLNNFFTENKKCDIEQFIYMMPFREMLDLCNSIWKNSSNKIFLGKYGKQLIERYKFNKEDKNLTEDEKFVEYVDYRYNGKMKLNKSGDEQYHPKLKDLMRKLANISKTNDENEKLMKSLLKFYLQSDIYRVYKKHFEKMLSL